MIYEDYVELPFIRESEPPSGYANQDQYPESLPRYFIEKYSKPDQKVFDPFLGFGTTASVTEELGRIPFGIEADGARFAWAAGKLEHWQNIVHADSADMMQHKWPKMDLCMTSPPWMPIYEKWNPLYGGHPGYKGYTCYLERLGYIFKQVKQVMKKKSLIVVHVQNLQSPRRAFTPLVKDYSVLLLEIYRFEAEVIVKWNPEDDYGAYTHCLVFKNS